MNKNFIFLALVLSVPATDLFPANRKTKHREHFAEEQAADNAARRICTAQQNKEHDQRAAYRDATKAIDMLAEIINFCFANQFNAAVAYIKKEAVDLRTLTSSCDYNILQLACNMYPFAEIKNIDFSDILAFLIEQGANPNHLNLNNQTILHVICQNNLGQQSHAVLDLILQHMDLALIDIIDTKGRHALHYACLNSSDVISYFIQHNIGRAFLCHRDYKNMTPMCLAATKNNCQLDQLLYFRLDGKKYLSPWLFAAQNDISCIVNKLIQNGHDINATSQDGGTALHIAVELGNIEATQALLNVPGINVNAVTVLHETALHFATRDGNTKIVQTLLNAPGINVNAESQHGCTALHWAALYSRAEIARILLNTPGINVNATAPHGNTTLHIAALYGCTKIVQALLEHGANPALHTINGRTAADVARTPEIRQLILAAAARQQ